jgi:hypothetical protein
LKNFGSILADQDLEDTKRVERDAFYRTIDSLQFALGEGDILELVKTYVPKGENQVNIAQFRDDLNQYLVSTPEF